MHSFANTFRPARRLQHARDPRPSQQSIVMEGKQLTDLGRPYLALHPTCPQRSISIPRLYNTPCSRPCRYCATLACPPVGAGGSNALCDVSRLGGLDRASCRYVPKRKVGRCARLNGDEPAICLAGRGALRAGLVAVSRSGIFKHVNHARSNMKERASQMDRVDDGGLERPKVCMGDEQLGVRTHRRLFV